MSLDSVSTESSAVDGVSLSMPRAATGSSARQMPSIDGDLVRSYLRDIGRVPLLSHEQEITLGRQVQELMQLEELREELKLRAGGEEPSPVLLAEAAGLSPQLLSAPFIATATDVAGVFIYLHTAGWLINRLPAGA